MAQRKIKILTVALVLMSAGVSFAKTQANVNCESSGGGSEIACQMESYKKANLPCQGDAGECSVQIQQSFKSLESSFGRCLPQTSEAMNVEVAGASREECQNLEKFVVDHVIPNNPFFGQVARALKFINQRVQAKSVGRKQAGL